MWSDIWRLLDSYCEEIDWYFSDSSLIWPALVRAVVRVQPQDDDQVLSARFLVMTLGMLLRRVDIHWRRSKTPKSIKPILCYVEAAFLVATQSWDPERMFNDSWRSLTIQAGIPLPDAPSLEHAMFVTELTIIAMTPGPMDPAAQRQELSQNNNGIINTVCQCLSTQEDWVAEAAIWALSRHATQWLDHDDDTIHAAFLHADLVSGMVKVTARAFGRSPYRGTKAALENIRPLMSVLLRMPCWVMPMMIGWRPEKIEEILPAGPSLLGSQRWEADEAELRAEVANQLSERALDTMLNLWRTLKSPKKHLESGDSSNDWDQAWFTPDAIDSIVQSYSQRNDFEDEAFRVLGVYSEELLKLGEGRAGDSRRMRDAIDTWTSGRAK